MNVSGNGRDPASRRERADAEIRTLRADLARLREQARAALDGADRAVGGAVGSDPLVAAAAVAGLGFLLGGGLTPRVRALLLGVGSRYAASWLGVELNERARRQRGAAFEEDPS